MKKLMTALINGRSEISIKKVLVYLLLPLIYILAIRGDDTILITIIVFVGGLLGLRSWDKINYK